MILTLKKCQKTLSIEIPCCWNPLLCKSAALNRLVQLGVTWKLFACTELFHWRTLDCALCIKILMVQIFQKVVFKIILFNIQPIVPQYIRFCFLPSKFHSQASKLQKVMQLTSHCFGSSHKSPDSPRIPKSAKIIFLFFCCTMIPLPNYKLQVFHQCPS